MFVSGIPLVFERAKSHHKTSWSSVLSSEDLVHHHFWSSQPQNIRAYSCHDYNRIAMDGIFFLDCQPAKRVPASAWQRAIACIVSTWLLLDGHSAARWNWSKVKKLSHSDIFSDHEYLNRSMISLSSSNLVNRHRLRALAITACRSCRWTLSSAYCDEHQWINKCL